MSWLFFLWLLFGLFTFSSVLAFFLFTVSFIVQRRCQNIKKYTYIYIIHLHTDEFMYTFVAHRFAQIHNMCSLDNNLIYKNTHCSVFFFLSMFSILFSMARIIVLLLLVFFLHQIGVKEREMVFC